VAAAAFTVTAAVVAAMAGVMLSVAVMVRLPAVFSVAPFEKVWTPVSVPGTKV
jgi:hypothetical protein